MLVLNVDDHAPTRFLRTRILTGAGFQVAEAATGKAAADRAEEGGIDVVLLDVRLPDTDGITLCAQLKARRPDLPVALISAVHRTATARQDGLAAGADAYLLEPVEPVRLVRVLTHLHTGTLRAQETVWIHTDGSGAIVDISAAAAAFLSMSPRGALGKSLPLFFVSDRARLVSELERAADGQIVDLVGKIRPRDRRLRSVRVDITVLGNRADGRRLLQWLLEPLPGGGDT
jgi:CheY-like chemotaxis protein